MPQKKDAPKKFWSTRTFQLAIITLGLVPLVLLSFYEGTNAVGAYYFVKKGEKAFEQENYQEALQNYEKANSFWSRTLLIKKVVTFPAISDVEDAERKIQEEEEATLKKFTPQIKVLSWEAKNLECNERDGNCHEISRERFKLIKDVYGLGNSIKVTRLIATLKNESDFPAFFLEASLSFVKNGIETEPLEVLKPTDFTYIPPKGKIIVQRSLKVGPKGSKPKFVAKGVAYPENGPYYSTVLPIKVTDFMVVKKYRDRGYGQYPVYYLRINLKNTSKEILSQIGINATFTPVGGYPQINGESEYTPSPYQQVYLPSVTPDDWIVGESREDFFITKKVIDESKLGRPVVEKEVTLKPNGTFVYEKELWDDVTGINEMKYIFAFGHVIN